jgi:hypothetical protein
LWHVFTVLGTLFCRIEMINPMIGNLGKFWRKIAIFHDVYCLRVHTTIVLGPFFFRMVIINFMECANHYTKFRSLWPIYAFHAIYIYLL